MLKNLRLTPRTFSLRILPLALLATPSTVFAQVTDADRAAARELATQGLQLQQAGNYTEALDRFDRAQAVFSAPTHLLHIAECEAALGKLVESAETYRTLVHTPLPQGSPNAFVQAQQEGAAELAQVEPRIPQLRIIIRPSTPANSTIYIDNDTKHPVNTALVGVLRPTDPGTHTISLLAPGYARADQQITLKEKETKDVAFNLGGAPGGFYTQPTSPSTTQPAPQPYAPPPPTMYTPPPPVAGPPAEPQPARGGFMIGATLGALLPAGNLVSGTSLSSAINGGAAVQINGGFRFARRLYAGLTFEHGFLSAAGSSSTSSASANLTTSVDSNYIGFDFGFISNPEGVGFFGKVGVGYRILDTSATVTDPASGAATTTSNSFNGPEFTIGAGVHIALGPWVRLIPGASLSIGQFSSESSGTLTNPDTHEFILIGVTALVDFSRKH